MVSPSDRLRRVLSDGALPQGVPPLERGRVRPAPSLERERKLAALAARLSALGVAAPRAPATAQGAAPPVGPSDRRPLAEVVRGLTGAPPAGGLVRTERRFPLEALHGRVVLAEALAHALPLRTRERRAGHGRTLDLERALFLDTETTGLAGGTGTVAFLVGTGRVEGDAFVVRQFGLSDYHDEPALLAALAEELGERTLVSFNGRAFDWPLLATRFALHRVRVAERSHLDLLPRARRLWSGSLPSCSLATLERHVLGLEREHDLPGAAVPQAWFGYLRTGDASQVARAYQHNETDVVSMLALVARVGAVLGGARASLTASPRNHLGTARLLIEHGECARAVLCLEAGVLLAEGAERRPLLHLRARLARRLGEYEVALEAWRRAIEADACLDAVAQVEAAKILEHHLGRPAEALALTQDCQVRLARAALGASGALSTPSTPSAPSAPSAPNAPSAPAAPELADLERRAARLLRRLRT